MDQRYVIILDRALPTGLAANACAVLSASVGGRAPEIIGPDITDNSGLTHPGITRLPIAVLGVESARLPKVRDRAEQAGIWTVGFTRTAQRSKHYDHYTEQLCAACATDLKYLGIALYGDRKKVTGLTGDLPLLR